jgi:two-component system response regulator YesN
MRIVIVEDEPRIREGLARLIRKVDAGYEIVGEAENGLEGLRIIDERRPDLVITDVRMPDLDGLEMLRRLEESSVKVKALILSAFSEFSYACEAISLGVGEYLLKPVNVGDLTRSLKKIESELAAEELPKRREEGLSLEGALYSIALGGVAVDEELRVFLERNCNVDTRGYFALAAIYLGAWYGSGRQRIMKCAQALLAERSDFGHRILESPRNGRLILVAFNIDDAESTRAWFEGRFAARIKASGQGEPCVAWGCFRGLDGLRDASQRVDACLDWGIVLGSGAMIVWPDVERTPVALFSYPIQIESAVRSALCSLDHARYESGIIEFLGYLRNGRVYSPKDIKNSLVRFYWSVLGTAREIAYESYAALAQQEILERITFAVTWGELEGAAMTLLELIPRDAESSPGSVSLVHRAENVVRQFYSQGISLGEVAQKVGVTTEYLSAQFHRESGMTFSVFMRAFRVRKAKELLLGTDLMLHSVGEQVGYRDSKYFCRVFKEVTGQSPSEYRRANR